MQRRTKIGLTALVLGVGISGALHFRKTDTPTAPPKPDAAPSATAATPASQSTTSSSAKAAGDVKAVTSLAPTPTPPAPYIVHRADAERTLVDLHPPPRTHKVADGDTLMLLAQRYLGRADRHMEIYEHNRDVLRSPQLLPIGTTLRIPSSAVAPRAAGSEARPDVLPSAPLVPLATPPAAGTAAAAQQISANHQTAANRKIQPRTYTVRQGDNLVDIARKLYGDGRRYEQLFEANRQAITNPVRLKPGTVLVVP